jgi:hypothetical protein
VIHETESKVVHIDVHVVRHHQRTTSGFSSRRV